MRQQVEWPGAGAGRGGGEPGWCAPPPRFQEDASGSSSELGGGLASASPPSPPRAPRFILAAGKPAAPADLLFGFVCASAAGADSPSFETSRPRRSAICSVCRGDALCRVCLQRSRAPCHVFPSPPRAPPPMSRWLSPAAPRTPCLGGGRDQGPKAAAPGAVAGPSPAGQAGDSLGASRPAREPGSAWAEASLCCQYAQVTCKYYAVL